MVVVEISVDAAVPLVRNYSQQMLIYAGVRIVRINMVEAEALSRDELERRCCNGPAPQLPKTQRLISLTFGV